MNVQSNSKLGLVVRFIRFAPTRLTVLYITLMYLYLSGFFFRQEFAQGPLQSVAASLMSGLMMLVVYASIVRYTENRPVTELSLQITAIRELSSGALLGFGLYTACIVILMILGNYQINGVGDWHILIAGMAAPLATAVFEELVYRGCVFRLAETWFGTWVALLISSVLFGFAHYDAAGVTVQGLISISTWAGLLLVACYLLTRRLWLGIGLHAAWNYTQGAVYSGIVSGNVLAGGFLSSTLQGSDWLTGGAFGIEASLIALLVCGGTGLWMLRKAIQRGHIYAPALKRQAR